MTIRLRVTALREIVFGDRHVDLSDGTLGCVFPGAQTHVGFCGIGAAFDDFCSGVAMYRPMELVLNCGIEFLGNGVIGVVVDARRVDVGDFLVKAPLRSTDLSNAFEKFVKIILTNGSPVF